MSDSSEKGVKLSRTKNAVRNIYSGIFNKVVMLFFPFLLRTLLIKKIGIEYAGLNSLFSSILQVLNLTELGFASASVYSMYKPIAENDGEMICALLGFYRKVYTAIGTVMMTIGLVLMPFLPKLIKGSAPSDINIYLLYFIFLLNTSLSYLVFGYKNSLLNAYQRRDVIANILTATHGLMYVAQIIILLLLKSYYLYIIMLPVFTVINNVLVSVAANRMYPMYFCTGGLPASVKKDIGKKVSGLMINKLCQISRNSLDNIFISSFLGLVMTTIYSNYMLIFTSLTGIFGIIINSLQAGIGNSIQTETKQKNYSDMKKMTLLYQLLTGWCAACMLCIYQPFMELWIGKEFMLSFFSVSLICFYFYILKMGDINSLYFNGSGLWWNGRYRSIVESLLNLFGNFILVIFWGVDGIILASIISVSMGHIWGGQFVFRLYYREIKFRQYFLMELSIFAVNAVLCSVFSFAAHFIKMENASFNFAAVLLFAAVIVTPVYVFVYLFLANRLKMKFDFKKMLKKGR